jgi:tetratricopeptide (TPR) repeat protein
LYKNVNQFGTALQYLEIVELLNPEQENLYYHLGMAAYGDQKIEKAQRYFKEAYRRDPSNPELLKNIGKMSFEL